MDDIQNLFGDLPSEEDKRLPRILSTFGVISNPFPSAGQSSDHPRMPVDGVDKQIVNYIRQFEENGYKSCVILLVGTQGSGKTNVLNNYQKVLESRYKAQKDHYVIRYYPDPEPTFDTVIRLVFQELGPSQLHEIITALADKSEGEREGLLEKLRSFELRVLVRKLIGGVGNDTVLSSSVDLAMEWLVGTRLLNRHKAALGVQFRLDTVESRTQALRDVVHLAAELGLLHGIFLFLDELEKQEGTLSTTYVLKYLSAIRALIDALPKNLFMMVAITPDARRRYFSMLPAIAGRWQNGVDLPLLLDVAQAQQLATFYENRAREEAKASGKVNSSPPKSQSVFTGVEIKDIFDDLFGKAAARASKGVTQRDFLNLLHQRTELKFALLASGSA
jgi:hypothetical protein